VTKPRGARPAVVAPSRSRAMGPGSTSPPSEGRWRRRGREGEAEDAWGRRETRTEVLFLGPPLAAATVRRRAATAAEEVAQGRGASGAGEGEGPSS